MVKTCTKCQETLDLSKFYKCKNGKFGRSYTCKKCCKLVWFRPDRASGKERQRINKFRSKMTPGVYLVYAKNGTYVGQSKQIQGRVANHKDWNPRSPIKGFIKYKILEVVKDEQLRLKREKYWIDKLKPTLNALV